MHYTTFLLLVTTSISITTNMHAAATEEQKQLSLAQDAKNALEHLEMSKCILFNNRTYFGERITKNSIDNGEEFIAAVKNMLPVAVTAVKNILNSEPKDFESLEKILAIHQQCQAAIIFWTNPHDVIINPDITEACQTLRKYKEEYTISPRTVINNLDNQDELGRIQYPGGREQYARKPESIASN